MSVQLNLSCSNVSRPAGQVHSKLPSKLTQKWEHRPRAHSSMSEQLAPSSRRLCPWGQDTDRPLVWFLTLVGAGCYQCLACFRSKAGDVVHVQTESHGTGAVVGAFGVVAAVRAKRRHSLALVNVVAGQAVFVELVSEMTDAVITAKLINAVMLAAMSLASVSFDALVDVCE